MKSTHMLRIRLPETVFTLKVLWRTFKTLNPLNKNQDSMPSAHTMCQGTVQARTPYNSLSQWAYYLHWTTSRTEQVSCPRSHFIRGKIKIHTQSRQKYPRIGQVPVGTSYLYAVLKWMHSQAWWYTGRQKQEDLCLRTARTVKAT